MKTPDKCKRCKYYGSNLQNLISNIWCFNLLFGNKCDKYSSFNSWAFKLVIIISAWYTTNTQYNTKLGLFVYIMFGIPLMIYFLFVQNITKKTLFLCAVQGAFRKSHEDS